MSGGTASLSSVIGIAVSILVTDIAHGAECLGKWVMFQTGGYSTRDEAPVAVVRIDDIIAISYPKPKEAKVAEIILEQPNDPYVRYEYVSQQEYTNILNCLRVNRP